MAPYWHYDDSSTYPVAAGRGRRRSRVIIVAHISPFRPRTDAAWVIHEGMARRRRSLIMGHGVIKRWFIRLSYGRWWRIIDTRSWPELKKADYTNCNNYAGTQRFDSYLTVHGARLWRRFVFFALKNGRSHVFMVFAVAADRRIWTWHTVGQKHVGRPAGRLNHPEHKGVENNMFELFFWGEKT